MENLKLLKTKIKNQSTSSETQTSASEIYLRDRSSITPVSRHKVLSHQRISSKSNQSGLNNNLIVNSTNEPVKSALQTGDVDDKVKSNEIAAAPTLLPCPDSLKTSSSKLPSIIWKCQACNLECIPVRRESRCLCGHRLKEHEYKNSKSKEVFKCSTNKCTCSNFFFVVAEGSWILKCRCKHKHIEHDPCKPPYLCKKCKPSTTTLSINQKESEKNQESSNCCFGFDSPLICNCGHSLSTHEQSIVVRSMLDIGPQIEDVYIENISNTNSDSGSATTTKRSYAVRQDGLIN